MTDTEPSPYTSTGLVRELADEMKYKVPTHPDWPETLACGLIGMLMGKERYIKNIFGTLYANFMSLYVGSSGLSFKTVSLKKYMRPIIAQLTLNKNNEIIKGYGYENLDKFNEELRMHQGVRNKNNKEWKDKDKIYRAIEWELVDYLKPERFTEEKLSSILVGQPVGIIVGDEFTKMFKGNKAKDYLANIMETLSRLADCDMEKVATQARGIEYPEHAYVGFVSATTPLLMKIMDDDFFLQGTGNRILWILDDLQDKEEISDKDRALNSVDFFYKIEYEEDENRRIAEMVSKLERISHLPEGMMIVDFEATAILGGYRVDKYNEALRIGKENILNTDSNLIVRLAQGAMKLAMIHCAGRYALDEDLLTKNERMEISEEDAEWAIQKMERHFIHYKNLMKMAPEIRRSTTRTFSNDFERILSEIDKARNRGEKLTVPILRRQTGWLRDDCNALFETMLLNKQIRRVLTRVQNRRDPTIHFVRFDSEVQSDPEFLKEENGH